MLAMIESPMSAQSQKAPKPTALRDFFASLYEKTKGFLLRSLNEEAAANLSQRENQDKLEPELLKRAKYSLSA